MNRNQEYISFASWQDVLLHVRKALPTYYQAPLDPKPVRVTATLRRGQKVHVVPPSLSGADPFIADAGHLERFRFRIAPAAAIAPGTRRTPAPDPRRTGWQTISARFPGAYILWSVPVDQGGELLAVSVNSCVLILHEYHNGHGWQIYAPVVESGRIDVTLDAIEARSRNLEYDYLAKDRP